MWRFISHRFLKMQSKRSKVAFVQTEIHVSNYMAPILKMVQHIVILEMYYVLEIDMIG